MLCLIIYTTYTKVNLDYKILYPKGRFNMNNTNSLTPQEVANILNIAKNTVYELIKRGELNAYKVGRKVRVEPKDVEDYINKGKSKTGPINTTHDNINSPIIIENQLNSFSSQNISSVNMQPNSNLVICGQDIILDILSSHLEYHLKGIPVLRSYSGSYNGLYSLYQGTAQLATAHLWDGDTGEYNIPFVRRIIPGIPCVIIRLITRMQGFYVKNGNPKKITDWRDLKRSDITIINREKGSGTRVLLDEHLRLMGIYGSSIKGYNHESVSHFAVASIVAMGGADLSLGTEKVASQVQGVDFIPLQEEQYDLVIKKEDLSKPQFQAILKILRSDEFKMEIQGIGNHDISQMGTIVAET